MTPRFVLGRIGPLSAMCGRLRVGKENLHVCRLNAVLQFRSGLVLIDLARKPETARIVPDIVEVVGLDILRNPVARRS
jgi:hypothetical protein